MKFWDSSAIVPLLVAEASTRQLQAVALSDPSMLVWWASEVECVSALARLDREGALSQDTMTAALKRLRDLADGWNEVDASDSLRETAVRFLRVHPLRAADALQLAAAFVAAERRPTALQFVTRDERLATAARKEGFTVPDFAAST